MNNVLIGRIEKREAAKPILDIVGGLEIFVRLTLVAAARREAENAENGFALSFIRVIGATRG